MKRFRMVLALVAVSSIIGCGGTTTAATPTSTTGRFKAEVWVDNWFAFYLGEKFVAEDRVSITTERSFNSETFTFDGTYPLELNFVVKDYKANDSGLEYIGQPNQQMGDGGFIMQITDLSSGKVVATSGPACKCLVIHKAPLNPSCEKDSNPLVTCLFKSDPEPDGWKRTGFNTSAWPAATVYTAAQVGVKDGYNDITWNSAARLIWGSDLKADNTLLCKLTVSGS